jgi:hypothetical protein
MKIVGITVTALVAILVVLVLMLTGVFNFAESFEYSEFAAPIASLSWIVAGVCALLIVVLMAINLSYYMKYCNTVQFVRGTFYSQLTVNIVWFIISALLMSAAIVYLMLNQSIQYSQTFIFVRDKLFYLIGTTVVLLVAEVLVGVILCSPHSVGSTSVLHILRGGDER